MSEFFMKKSYIYYESFLIRRRKSFIRKYFTRKGAAPILLAIHYPTLYKQIRTWQATPD